jgi:signal transduction protein with GAF and PtsI domain
MCSTIEYLVGSPLFAHSKPADRAMVRLNAPAGGENNRRGHSNSSLNCSSNLFVRGGHADMGINEPTIALILAGREPTQVADLREEVPSAINEITLRAGYRARLVAPLIRGEDVVGLLVVRRKTPGAFPQNTVDLIKTFAAQSAVAIENARLFQNVEASLRDLRTAQDRLVQTEKLASLGQLTAGIAHEIKNPLNFVTPSRGTGTAECGAGAEDGSAFAL